MQEDYASGSPLMMDVCESNGTLILYHVPLLCMGTTTLHIVLGNQNMVRFLEWKKKEKFPEDKSADSFAKVMLLRQLDIAVPPEIE